MKPGNQPAGLASLEKSPSDALRFRLSCLGSFSSRVVYLFLAFGRFSFVVVEVFRISRSLILIFVFTHLVTIDERYESYDTIEKNVYYHCYSVKKLVQLTWKSWTK